MDYPIIVPNLIPMENTIKTIAECLLRMEAQHQYDSTHPIGTQELFSHHIKKMVMSHCVAVIKAENRAVVPDTERIALYEDIFWYIANL